MPERYCFWRLSPRNLTSLREVMHARACACLTPLNMLLMPWPGRWTMLIVPALLLPALLLQTRQRAALCRQLSLKGQPFQTSESMERLRLCTHRSLRPAPPLIMHACMDLSLIWACTLGQLSPVCVDGWCVCGGGGSAAWHLPQFRDPWMGHTRTALNYRITGACQWMHAKQVRTCTA